MAIKKTRVYFPLGSEYFMESPWVEINGRRAFEPVEGQPQFKLADIVNEAVQKGQAVIDETMCLTDCYDSKSPAPNSNNYGGAERKSEIAGHGKEVDQIELNLKASTAGSDGVARIGLADVNLGIFGGVKISEKVDVGGTFGNKTLSVIGNLANYGFLKLSKLHFEADTEGFFATTPVLKTFSHTGVCVSDVRAHYPKASAEDDNTNIRTMDEKYLADKNIDMTMHGKNYLEIIVPDGRSANLTLYTCFYPKY